MVAMLSSSSAPNCASFTELLASPRNPSSLANRDAVRPHPRWARYGPYAQPPDKRRTAARHRQVRKAASCAVAGRNPELRGRRRLESIPGRVQWLETAFKFAEP